MVENLPAVQETWVRSLGQENPLEKGRAPHSSILAWRIPCIEEPGRLQSMGSQRVRNNGATNTFTFPFQFHKKKKILGMVGGESCKKYKWTLGPLNCKYKW